ncbi:ABC transporter ATP-binding protein [Porcipelethomonas sp.]|uniref:ABC transporter ATP-binding protein n=1 Tax=Porcipelethomonas sp. TaxID=2981675 RepID=UPI003EF5D458
MTAALKIEHLNKYFGKKQILHDISFETYPGEVFGFLGPNGAGKTTTIKIAVGHLRLDEGDIFINGKSIVKNFESAMADVGGIIENPEFYKYMTGMQNLRQYARMRGNVDEKRINEVVEIVGLKNRINDKVGKYSLGMRQRLGVAQAILHRPKLLILDEPTNGLDPAGIKELRDILKNLAHKENICVIVSSHLMSEMELMCDRVGIIVNGRLTGVHTVEEMISAASGDKERFIIRVSDCQKALEILDFVSEKAVVDEKHIEVAIQKDNEEEELFEITARIVSRGIKLGTVSPKENKKLEDVFIELTKSGGSQIG